MPPTSSCRCLRGRQALANAAPCAALALFRPPPTRSHAVRGARCATHQGAVFCLGATRRQKKRAANEAALFPVARNEVPRTHRAPLSPSTKGLTCSHGVAGAIVCPAHDMGMTKAQRKGRPPVLPRARRWPFWKAIAQGHCSEETTGLVAVSMAVANRGLRPHGAFLLFVVDSGLGAIFEGPPALSGSCCLRTCGFVPTVEWPLM